MKHLILLKGNPSTGKSTILRDYLPAHFDMPANKRIIPYERRWIQVIQRTIHRTRHAQRRLELLAANRYPITILAALDDSHVDNSVHLPQTVEEILPQLTSYPLRYYNVHTQPQPDASCILRHHERCAQELKELVDGILTNFV